MSFITTIRDYIELLNNVYDSVTSDINLQQIIYYSFLFVVQNLKFLFFYFISFQWIRDFCHLPVIVPQLSLNILKENYFLDSPLYNYFTFLETPFYIKNKFFIGFLNSFFLALPLSCSHIITLRRFLIQGFPAGIFSALGTIFGQCWFLTCVLFGFRLFVIPWFSLEPLTYIVGLFIVLYIVYDMAHEKRMRPITTLETFTFTKIFFLNFLLAWTEQTCIFQYLSNITFDTQPTILEIFSSSTEFEYFLLHGTYIFGIFIGSIIFTSLFGFFYLQLNSFLLKIFNFSYSRLINYSNFGFLTLLLAFSLSSIPYYGIDYLITKPLGFVSRDKLLDQTILSQTNLKDVVKLIGENSDYKSLDTDITHFDRGKYLNDEAARSFEDINYQGEYAWITRQDRRFLYRHQKAKDIISNFLKKTNKNTEILESKNKENDVQKINPNPNLRKNLYLEEQSIHFFNLNERFHIDYKLEDLKTAETFNILSDDSFNGEFIEEEPKSRIEKKIKQKYYSNPIYKFLLNNEIDSFMKRQSYILSSAKEKELFEKRLILTNYYDSIRAYKKLPDFSDFEYLFCGSKSYADRVYNHQFKGTLKIVRRLFNISLNQDQNPQQKIVLKFDQPLFKNITQKSLLHEELNSENLKQRPFLELSNPVPFYVGWDEQLRKLVITNRLLPKYFAGFEMKIPGKVETNEYWYLNNVINSSKKIEFTAWPIPKKILESQESKSIIPYSLLFESIKDPINKPLESFFEAEDAPEWIYETLPPNIKKSRGINEILPPTRGGLIWPGQSFLKFGIKNIKIGK